MGHLWQELLPRGGGDRRIELEEAVMRHRLEKDPGDFAANLNLGALALARLNPSDGVGMLRNAVRLDPARPDAHNMLGAALARLGRVAEAIGEFRRALELRPDFANARLNLASALVRAGEFESAVESYRQVLAAAAGDSSARAAVEAGARQLEDRGRTHEAEELYRELQEAKK
jgi:Flp pilus assembly protein TadD